jgi:hypothetical protein
MKMEHINEALAQLCPHGRWALSGDDLEYEDIVWLTDEYAMPGKDAVEAAVLVAAEQAAAAEYRRLRKPEYPPLVDFADAYYWAQNGDDTKMQAYLAAVSAVKAAHPKGA